MRSFMNVIDGRVVDGRSGERLTSYEPGTGAAWASIPRSGDEDVEAAVAAAQRGFDRWRRLAAKDRSAHLRALAELTREHAQELAELESRDTGRVIRETLAGHLPSCVEILHFHAGAADKLSGDTVNVGPGSVNLTVREPLGVVGVVIPWNSPMSLLSAKVGAALAAGNAVVVKPAEQACTSVLRWAELVAEQTDLPAGVINIVAGLGEEAGDALVRHPDVARITFTGSTETARIIAGRAATTLKQLHFELGGKSPNIVFADADLDAAVVGLTTTGVFTGNAGQSCIAGSRILVQADVFDEVQERIASAARATVVGDPLDPSSTMGAIVSDSQLERVRGYIQLGVEEGAELVFGGGTSQDLFPVGSPQRGGWFVEPTLFRTDDTELRICQEEIFGPVAVLTRFETDDEAVTIANGTRYGLAAGVWTRDLARAHRMIRDIRAGNVWVNAYPRIHWALPFGGVGDSGYGKDSGWESVLENTQLKTAWIELGPG
jgi:(Z)-2-((N-methylformamido)methylene)-5-hydroxybutyrolactone dehydrogenase